jgi:hypothetical protein
MPRHERSRIIASNQQNTVTICRSSIRMVCGAGFLLKVEQSKPSLLVTLIVMIGAPARRVMVGHQRIFAVARETRFERGMRDAETLRETGAER